MACTDRIILRASPAAEAPAPAPGQDPGAAGAPASLHLLPCCIEHNGPANVSAFFSVRVENADAKPPVLVAAFRGRRLRGASLELPSAFRGVVLREQEGQAEGDTTRGGPHGNSGEGAGSEACKGYDARVKGEGAEDENGATEGGEASATQWVQDGVFSSFTYWQHDTGPRESDGPHKALQWLSLAHQMHTPLNEGDMKKASDDKRL